MCPNYRLMRWLMAVAVLLCAAMATPPQARAGFWNEGGVNGYITPPGGADTFTIVFGGDQLANLAPTLLGKNEGSYVESREPGNIPVGSGPPTLSYDPINNTTSLIYSGPFQAGDSYHFGYSTVLPGGAEAPPGAPQDVLAKFYSSGGFPVPVGNPWFFPALGIGFGETSVGAYLPVLFGIQFTAADNQPFGTGIIYEWGEIPINLNVVVPIIVGNFLNDDNAIFPFENEPDTTLQLDSAQYFFSPTEIPLGDLNIDNTPPTDPRWQPISGFVPGTTLDTGQTATYYVGTPEPSSLTLLLSGVFGLFGYGWRRRKSAVGTP